MKLVLSLIILGSMSLNLRAQELQNTKQWKNYIVPVLNSNDLLRSKKMYAFQSNFPVMEEWHPEFIDSVLAKNGMPKEDWQLLYNTWKLNAVRTNPEWFQGITKEKKEALLKKYDKKKVKKYEVIGVSPVFVISPTFYMVEITRYCSGVCSSTTLYLMEYDEGSKSYQQKYSKNIKAS